MTRLTHALRSTLLSLGLLSAAAAPAGAASFAQGLSFLTGNQSLWGPGRSASSFGRSDSAGTTIAGVDVGGGYSFGASAGTVNASLGGSVQASYADQLLAPGTTQIALDFLGSSGSFSTSLGASASITGYVHDVPFYGPWEPCIYCKDWSLDTSASFAPVFGTQQSATDSFSVAGVGPDIGVASAQLTLNANQTARFRPTAFTGSLVATHRDTGASQVLPFSLSGVSVLDVDLDRAGLWDFDLLDLDIANTFASTIGANLSIDLSCCFDTVSKSFPFNGISLLNTPSFGLDFGSRSIAGAFSIDVVPEPSTALMLGVGLAGLAVAGRRPRRPLPRS